MIVVSFDQVLAIFVGSAAGNILFHAARSVYRAFRPAPAPEEDDEEDEAPSSAGPYRTSAAADGIGDTAEMMVAKDGSRNWRYRPQTTCPRCGEDSAIEPRGRYEGKHTYSLNSEDVSQQTMECSGHSGEPHVHYQCYDCGADWAEIPPEEYDEEDIQ